MLIENIRILIGQLSVKRGERIVSTQQEESVPFPSSTFSSTLQARSLFYIRCLTMGNSLSEQWRLFCCGQLRLFRYVRSDASVPNG